MNDKLTERRSIVFSPKMLDQLEVIEQKHGINRSEFVRWCVEYVLANVNVDAVLFSREREATP